jgi:hypothetical protein
MTLLQDLTRCTVALNYFSDDYSFTTFMLFSTSARARCRVMNFV